MKLRNLAALLIRVFALLGAIEIFAYLLEGLVKQDFGRNTLASLFPLIGFYFVIRYSKNIGALLCKGLEDDAEENNPGEHRNRAC